MRASFVLLVVLIACSHKHGGTPDAGSTCGDGVVDPDEQCDDGPLNGTAGDGCTASCMFACIVPANDCPAAAPCTLNACKPDNTCGSLPDMTQDGMSCGTGLICQNGECISATCGNGIVEANEECDFGTMNGPNTGCESDCKFSCTISPNSCDDGNACNGAETCGAVTVGGNAGQKCTATAPPANGTGCGGANICVNGSCVPPSCGDGFIEGSEQCDDGSLNGTAGDGCTATCTYVCQNASTDCGMTPQCEMWTCTAQHTCRAVANSADNGMACGMVAGYTCQNGACVSSSATCGNGMREGGEQCDDGNTTNLDGCDANCKFEEVQRVNTMSVAFSTDTYCTKNALGTAIVGSTAQSQINSAITSGIGDGSITIIWDALGLDDLSGQTDSMLQIGVLGGTPATSSTATYNGASDLDWWYNTDPTTIDATRTAKTQMAASLAGGVLNAGPAEIVVTVNFVGVSVTMDMFGTKITARSGASSTPTASSGMSPGHLAGEHLDPALTSYASATGGEVCGNTTAASLAAVQVPSILVGSTCNNVYKTSNTLLDVYISGCTALFIPEVKKTQPDTSRDGATYVFTPDSNHHVVSCTRNGVADTLSDCLAKAAFTSLFKMTSDRVIMK
jgi:cysteine-rich repeat protein